MIEGEVQRALFADIASFAQRSDWRDDPLIQDLQAHAPAQVEELAEFLHDSAFKRLFLKITAEWTGPKPFVPYYKAHQQTNVFLPRCEMEVEGMAIFQSIKTAGASTQRGRYEAPEGGDPHNLPYREFAAKKRCFLLLDDLCTMISDLPTVGDAMAVAR